MTKNISKSMMFSLITAMMAFLLEMEIVFLFYMWIIPKFKQKMGFEVQ